MTEGEETEKVEAVEAEAGAEEAEAGAEGAEAGT